jgi:hypothetical protein
MTTVTVVQAQDCDLREELKYDNLNKRGFVRGVTALDQWHFLVSEAWAKSRLPENTFVRDYLVTMLNRFSTRVDLFNELAAFEFCEYVLGVRKVDDHCIQDIADISLQYVAFFPE